MKDWSVIFRTKTHTLATFPYDTIPIPNRKDIVVLDTNYRIVDVIYNLQAKQVVIVIEVLN